MPAMLTQRLVSANLERLAGVQVIYTDLDGTMLGPRGSFLHAPDGTLTDEPTRALLAAHAAGVDVVPASGRALRGLQGDARLLGMANVIAEMGARISYDFGREVVNSFGEMPPSDLMPAHLMESCGAVALVLSEFADRLEHHTPWSAGRECTQLFRGFVDTAAVDAALESAGHGWLRLHDNGRLHGVYFDLEQGGSRAYHLQPRGMSKGVAVGVDRQRRALALERTVAIGDAFADLELAAHVGTMVIVGDALSDDPALADAVSALDNVLITDRPQNLGWADLLREVAARA